MSVRTIYIHTYKYTYDVVYVVYDKKIGKYGYDHNSSKV